MGFRGFPTFKREGETSGEAPKNKQTCHALHKHFDSKKEAQYFLFLLLLQTIYQVPSLRTRLTPFLSRFGARPVCYFKESNQNNQPVSLLISLKNKERSRKEDFFSLFLSVE